MTVTPHTDGGSHSPEDVRLGLTQLALQGGNAERSVRLLKASGLLDVIPATLHSWRERYANVYMELQEEVAGDLNKRVAARSMELAEKAADVVEELVDATGVAVRTGEIVGRDLAVSARNLSQVHVNAIDKARVLRDEPTSITKIDSLEEAVAVLAELGVLSSEEPTDAEVVEPDQIEAPVG